eukprot:TRINITY_DN85770_c0_g1_i1.p1 TRINITY_DN85770_c0_g1~~TRINITY_DN85770_c0_g1_i1.p1  ORF type:complete len:522 (-),score=243.59 TRINITY_DN85770_c0_g1_i1:88-1527(-)
MGNCWCCLQCHGNYAEYEHYQKESTKERPGWMPCNATGLYMQVPHVLGQRELDELEEEKLEIDDANQYSLRKDAKIIYESMKGIGTHDSELGRIFGTRTRDQIQKIKKIFNAEFGGSGGTLEEWIKDDTSGDWENLLLKLSQTRGQRNAERIFDSIDGPGTADDELREVMTTCSPAEMHEIQEAYEQEYKKSLVKDVQGDTSFNYQKIMLAILNPADFLAIRLNKGLKRVGTDDGRLIRILTSVPRSNYAYRKIMEDFEDHFNTGWRDELEFEATLPDLQDVKRSYQRLFGRSLAEDVKRDTSGNFRKAMLTLLRDPAETTAISLHDAMAGKGTWDDMLIEIVTTRSNNMLLRAADKYKAKFGRTLEKDVKGDTQGDYRQTILDLIKPRAMRQAETLKDSFEGVGTDDDRVIRVLAGRSRHEIRQIARAYEELTGNPLEKDLRSETSFWYRRTLVYILRQAEEKLVYVPESQLLRMRDI